MNNRENSGALFRNDRREKETHPQMKGSINVEGREYWLSAWTKKNEDGSFKLISLSVKPKEERNQQADRRQAFGSSQKTSRSPQASRGQPTAQDTMDEFESDDIPF